MSGDNERRLTQMLDREIQAGRALAETLVEEKAALTGSSAEAVLEQAERKTTLLSELNALDAERRALCQRLNLSLPPRTRGRVPAIAEVSAAVSESWQTLLEIMAGCRIANEVNGYIINARRAQIEQLVHAVRGVAPMTYGRAGRPQGASLRPLARA